MFCSLVARATQPPVEAASCAIVGVKERYVSFDLSSSCHFPLI